MKTTLEEIIKLKRAVNQLQHEVFFKGAVLKDPLANKPSQEAHQFKVGDEVIIRGLSDMGKDYIGRTAVVRNINSNPLYHGEYIVDFSIDGCVRCYRPCDLELVKVDYEAKYNELVKMNENLIHETELLQAKLKQELDDYDRLGSQSAQMIIDLKLKLKQDETAELKVGDKVLILAEKGQFGSMLKGKTGTIKAILPKNEYETHPVYVVLEDGCTVGWYDFKDLKKVG